MKGDILLQNIQVEFIPAVAGKNAKEDKKKVKEAIETKLGKNITNVRKRCADKPLWISITFHLQKESTHSKKDIHSLANVLISVLSSKMSSGKTAEPGLDIINDDSTMYKMIFEKKLVESGKDSSFVFSIYEWSYI